MLNCQDLENFDLKKSKVKIVYHTYYDYKDYHHREAEIETFFSFSLEEFLDTQNQKHQEVINFLSGKSFLKNYEKFIKSKYIYYKDMAFRFYEVDIYRNLEELEFLTGEFFLYINAK